MSNPTTWRILIVDDDAQLCEQVREYLEGEFLSGTEDGMLVEPLTDFGVALDRLESGRFDLVILDVRLGSWREIPEQEAGAGVLEAIRERRFVPVVFYTGLPNLVKHLQSPLIRVVEKTAGLSGLREAVQHVFASRLPIVNRALLHHLESVQREYMWDFVAQNWALFGDTSDRTALAYLLARRLALSLSGPGIQQLARDLGDPIGVAAAEGRVHPMQYYVMPPVEPSPLAGDLYQGKVGDEDEDEDGYWLLLTPSCDMVAGREKADWIVFARCAPLIEQPEYQKWREGLPKPSRPTRGDLESLLHNNRKNIQADRFYFLPGALTLPDMLVDFQQLTALPRSQISKLDRLASLDSPFAEAVLSRFVRYFGRLGTPDLDIATIIAGLQDEASRTAR